MKREMKNIALLFIAVIGLATIVGCEKETNNGSDLPKETLILNNWIWEG